MPSRPSKKPSRPGLLLLAIGAFALGTYHRVFEAELIQRSGDPNTADPVVGSLLVVLVFEAARRILGWALPVICGLLWSVSPSPAC